MWGRVLALWLDLLILSFVYFVIGFTLGLIANARGDRASLAFLSPAPEGIPYTVLTLVYFAWLWTSGATFGQRATRLWTLNAADGSLMTWNQSILRWLYLFGPVAVLNVFITPGLAGETMAAFARIIVTLYWVYLLWTAIRDPKRQGFHDLQARTVVAHVLPPS